MTGAFTGSRVPSHRAFTCTSAGAVVFVSLLLACAPSPVQTAIAPDISARESATSLASEGWTLENLIAGRVAGASAALTSTRGLQIRIRGSDNPPLVIVDGTPLDNSSIPLINSYDIERIEVLKNPADVALYGARGANGVVRITTRRPGSPPAPAR